MFFKIIVLTMLLMIISISYRLERKIDFLAHSQTNAVEYDQATHDFARLKSLFKREDTSVGR